MQVLQTTNMRKTNKNNLAYETYDNNTGLLNINTPSFNHDTYKKYIILSTNNNNNQKITYLKKI